MQPFIAHDWCGWDDRYGRYTVVPGAQTLVCRPDMSQVAWDKAQLEFLKPYAGQSPSLIVYECADQSGPYRPSERTLGTVDEIVARLERRLNIHSSIIFGSLKAQIDA